METTHTPEPWKLGRAGSVISESKDGLEIIGATGEEAINYYGGNLIAESISQANAARIVACVNACAGIENPQEYMKGVKLLEKTYHELQNRNGDLNVQNSTLKAERQELINLLKQSHDILTKRSIKRSELFDAMTSKFLQALKEQNP